MQERLLKEPEIRKAEIAADGFNAVFKECDAIKKRVAQIDNGPLFAEIDRIKAAIVETLSKGDRVELIPVKDGVKVVRVRREEVKK